MGDALWVGGTTISSAIDVVDGVPLWEPRTVGANGNAVGVLDPTLAPLWETRPGETARCGPGPGLNGSALWVRPTNSTRRPAMGPLDRAPLWESGRAPGYQPTKSPVVHLASVRLPHTVETEETDQEDDEPAEAPSGGLSLAAVGRLAVRTYLGARRAAGDPRLSGVLRAAPSVAYFIARSRARSASASLDDTVVPVRATPGLALQAYLDEVLVAVLRHPELLPKESDCASAAADIERLRVLFEREGWLERPAEYHRTPPPPDDIELWDEHRAGLAYEHAVFSSGWEPNPFEPGWARWMGHESNRTVHAWVSRVPGHHHRSWLVCAHGLGMGNNPAMDLRAFRASQLVRRGINVVVPVLPLHGPRATGRARGEDLMTIDMVDSMHGVAQAAWDVRRIIRWLREEQGAQQIGVIGYSLGGLVASVVAALEDDLACVIAGIPVVDLPHLVRRHSPPSIARLADTSGVLGPGADEVHRVVSPLAMQCKVPFERRFIFGGLADRMSTFDHARRLWLHWDRPAFETYAGGHVGFFWSVAVKRFVDDALRRSYTNAAAA